MGRQKLNPPKTKRIPSRLVAGRYNVTVRTIDRWLAIGVLPPPVLTINKVRYWDQQQLDDFDAALVAEQKAKRQGITPEVIPQAPPSNGHAG